MTNRKNRLSNGVTNWVLTPFLFLGHIVYEHVVGYWLFDLAGGVSYHPEEPIFKTHLGGISWAFETPMYVPGSYLMAKSNIGPCMWDGAQWGLYSVFLASLVTAIVIGQIIKKAVNNDKNIFGKFMWKLIISALGVVFIPVPVEMTLVYEFTVLC